ncbi:Bax inhibitor-1/YccA family protein [Conexibacter sp. CPCC 206217]|uniref:Bax inhibitor-1/YccA family protein n=1 Tax=Conexibacter sp. CPCC 206217 TaxID=3064574 RepID=UPI00271A9638|nr:Bax inhibitor-1/YccA family protein [Conexibacter sp. CPCC 206217]MDO8211296.1 Bax inhibitor-1/YccA family protein [Conexibacter sp. CPCC 206217]
MRTTSNPALKAFGRVGSAASAADTMTIRGTVDKTLLLLLIAFIAGATVFGAVDGDQDVAVTVMLPAALIGLGVAIATIFKPQWSPWTAPIYALVEGVLLGAITALFEQEYPGIAVQAAGLTFGVAGVMLVVYQTRIIKVTDKFRLGVVAATGAIFLFYLVCIVLSIFGMEVSPLNDASPLGIGISLVIVGVAALNLVLDFDFITRGAQAGAPKVMEWFGAFSLLVTLVWLYLEMLRLLGQLRS